MDFYVADFSKGDNAKDILSKAGKGYSVILTVEDLEKMAFDEKYEKEYMEKGNGLKMQGKKNLPSVNSGVPLLHISTGRRLSVEKVKCPN